MSRALLYKLDGSDDHLLQINVDPEQEGGKIDPPQILLILDASGSMGNCVALAEQAVGMACLEMGYDQSHQIEELYFSDKTFKANPTVQELINSKRHSMGMTYMKELPDAIKRVLNTDPSQGFQIIVISDGVVHDKDIVVQLMTQLGRDLAGRSGPVSVALIRLMTDRNASPDTKALSCVGALNTQGIVPVNDISAWNGQREYDAVKAQIMTTLTSHFGQGGRQTWEILGDKPSFRRLPTDKYRKCLMLTTGTTFLLIKSSELDGLKLELGGKPIEIIEMEGIESEEQIAELLSFIEQQIRLWTVMGTQKDLIKQTMDWLRKLSQRLFIDETVMTDQSLKSRSAQLRKLIHKREKSLINNILQLENIDNMSQFNSQQQADFLRQAKDSKKGKNLVRRAKGKDADFDYDELARKALNDLAEVDVDAAMTTLAEEKGLISFYSQVNQIDVITDAKELLANLADVIEVGTSDDLLQLLGGVGIAFQGPIGEFPDPWRYYVHKVFPGCHLAQADLWMAYVQGHGSALCPPGLATGAENAITGVDAIASACPEVFALFVKKARSMLEVHASLSMRRMKARVPQDELALKTAVTYQLIKQLTLTPSHLEIQTLVWELQDLENLVIKRYADSFNDFAKNLLTAEPGAFMTGDLNISGANQLICTLLAHPIPGLLLTGQGLTAPGLALGLGQAGFQIGQLANILRALYALEIYHSVRGPLKAQGEQWLVASEKSLHQLLGIDLIHGGIPLDQEVSDNDADYPHQFDLEKIKTQIIKLLPKGYDFKSLARILIVRQAKAMTGNLADFQKKLIELLPALENNQMLIQMFGLQMSLEDWQAYQVLQVLLAPDLHQRVDVKKRSMKFPDLVAIADLNSFISANMAKIYKDDHHRRVQLQAKAIAENLAMRRAVERTTQAFIQNLGGHTHGGQSRKIFWDTLEGAMRSGDVSKVQAFVDKSNDCLHQGHRFNRMIRDYGTPEMIQKAWKKE